MLYQYQVRGSEPKLNNQWNTYREELHTSEQRRQELERLVAQYRFKLQKVELQAEKLKLKVQQIQASHSEFKRTVCAEMGKMAMHLSNSRSDVTNEVLSMSQKLSYQQDCLQSQRHQAMEMDLDIKVLKH
jgi:predicted  nucleic acid-binding Zn-ribbon protein